MVNQCHMRSALQTIESERCDQFLLSCEVSLLRLSPLGWEWRPSKYQGQPTCRRWNYSWLFMYFLWFIEFIVYKYVYFYISPTNTYLHVTGFLTTYIWLESMQPLLAGRQILWRGGPHSFHCAGDHACAAKLGTNGEAKTPPWLSATATWWMS